VKNKIEAELGNGGGGLKFNKSVPLGPDRTDDGELIAGASLCHVQLGCRAEDDGRTMNVPRLIGL